MTETTIGRCSYCGTEGPVFVDHIGAERVKVCDSNECNVEHDNTARDAEREMRDDARERAERDDFERYRGGW